MLNDKSKEFVLRHKSNKEKASALFVRADKQEQRGALHSAFRLMLAAAKLGDSGAQVNVGNYYDSGKGVRRNRSAALYWYKRAYRKGSSAAAHNIGILWRNDRCFNRALYWFERAIATSGGDDGEASFEIAKLYINQRDDRTAAIRHLKTVSKSKNVTEACLEQARRLLSTMSN